MKDNQNGLGTAENWLRKPDLPSGIQVPITETSDEEGQIEVSMVTTVSEIEAIDPQSLKEAMQRPDWPKWQITIRDELDALKRAGTWGIVEWQWGRNIVKNKWVFRIKKNGAGKVKHYKAYLVAKCFTQVHRVDYYDTWAPVAKLASIVFFLLLLHRTIGLSTCSTFTAPS